MEESLTELERLARETAPEQLPEAVREWARAFRAAYVQAKPREILPAKPDSPSVRSMKADEARTPRDWQGRQSPTKQKGV